MTGNNFPCLIDMELVFCTLRITALLVLNLKILANKLHAIFIMHIIYENYKQFMIKWIFKFISIFQEILSSKENPPQKSRGKWISWHTNNECNSCGILSIFLLEFSGSLDTSVACILVLMIHGGIVEVCCVTKHWDGEASSMSNNSLH